MKSASGFLITLLNARLMCAISCPAPCCQRLPKQVPPIRAATVNLLQLVTEILEERKLLDKTFEMQAGKGDDSTLVALRSVLKEDRLAQKIASQFDVASLDLLILTGVGCRLSHAAHAHPAVRAAPHHGQHAAADVLSGPV
jgi:hypothetical protein